jgi:hypothetical protein
VKGGGVMSGGPWTSRQRDVTRALKAVKAAGYVVDRVEIFDRLGNKTVIVMGQGDHTVRVDSDNESNERNPWDEVRHASDKKRPA